MNELKYEFVVKPGADPSQIRLRYRGAEKVSIDKDGRLEVTTSVASFKDGVPIAWQETAGGKKDISLAYDLSSAKDCGGIDGDETSYSYKFKVGAYDPALPLILDPAVLLYCGYIGGSSEDMGTGIAIDSGGCAYLTGYTYFPGTTFPVKVGPDLTLNGDVDSFVAKVKADGSGLIYCGFVGGSDNYGAEYGWGIAVDGSGCAYISGETFASQDSFPVTVGPDLTINGGKDAYVAKVSADGARLIYCGYIGGNKGDWGRQIAVDASGCAYVVGITDSTEASFPVALGPDLSHNGGDDAFIAKIKADGTGFDYCGYIGGANTDSGNGGIAVDDLGCVYITGETNSTESTFPVVGGPDLTFNGGPWDAFVAKVKADGTGLVYCGYIGGTNIDCGAGIDIDGSGCAYITGFTMSSEATFPAAGGPDLVYNGNGDAFVAKLRADGTGLVFCGYVGGTGTEMPYGIMLDASGSIDVTGYTSSTEATFPVKVGPDLSFNGGCQDVFIVKVRADGSNFVYAGYIGGSGSDSGTGIAVDSLGCAYIVGVTDSRETSFPVKEGPDLSYAGGDYDAFVAKVNSSGMALVYCGYLGGTAVDLGYGIGVDASGCAYIAGVTGSTQASFPVKGGPDLEYNGSGDAFVAKIKMIPWLRVTSPNGGEKWWVGSKHSITWESSDYSDQDKILYSTDKGKAWTTIVTATPDDGRYSWTVPNVISPTCWVRIDRRDNSAKDRSDRVFAIIPAPTIKVVSPNGGETWKAKTVHTIRWTTTGTLAAVKIEYSIDDGLNWMNIIASASNTGNYSWTVPNKPSMACRVRVRKPGSTTPADMSNGKFTIIGL